MGRGSRIPDHYKHCNWDAGVQRFPKSFVRQHSQRNKRQLERYRPVQELRIAKRDSDCSDNAYRRQHCRNGAKWHSQPLRSISIKAFHHANY
jgi:hypothetical protein